MKAQARCPSVAQLQLLLDQELDLATTADLEKHISDCSGCQDALDTLTGDHLHEARVTKAGSRSQHLHRAMERLKSQGTGSSAIRSPGLTGGFPDKARSEVALGALGRYDILREIGAGAIGVLFEAWDNELNRKVAIKVLRAIGDSGESRERLLREAQASVQLRHANVVEVYDFVQREDFQPCLVMELVEGGSVADWMRSDTITQRQAAFIVREAAIGLAQAHQAKLIHRDIKPSNLLLETKGSEITRVCVADFGLVSVVDADSELTRTGEIAGTPAYMSPEQIDAPSQVGFSSDVYSLGCVLYQLLTGAVPFEGTVRMVLWQVLHEEPLPPSRFDDRIPRSLEAICLKAMHKDPEHRYASAQALADDLNRYLDGVEVDARLPGKASLAWRQAKRHPTAAFGIAVSLLSILAVAVVSSLYAWRLADANHQTQVQATRADRGKEIALEVMESIVFDAYDKLDASFLDPDELQIQLLRAAAEGLSRIENDSGPTLFKRAETHARLGRALWRVSQLEEAQEQLLQATKAIDRMTVQQRNSIQCIRLQLRVGLDSAATSDELGFPGEALRTLAPMLRLADILADRSDATVESLRAAASVHQYYSYSVYGLEEEKARRNALSIHQRCGDLLELEDIDIVLRLQLERELAESLYFQEKLPEAHASWRSFLGSTKAVLESDVSRDSAPDCGVFSEWLHASAGLAECEIELGRRPDAVGRLEEAWSQFEQETQANFHCIEVSQGIWQLVYCALETELATEAEWNVKWLRRAANLIDQEAKFLDDGSLLSEQIQWKTDLLTSLNRLGSKEEAAMIEQQIQQLQAKESEVEKTGENF